MNVLIIEDELKIALFIKKYLEREKFFVTVCTSIDEALEQGYEDTHDIVILDLMLKGKSGEYFIQEIKKKHCNMPVLVLSAIGHIDKKVEMLNLGADDYLSKPFEMQELIARLQALYRRYVKEKKEESMHLGKLVFYKKQNKVQFNDKDVLLTQKEADILNFLLENKGNVVTNEDILINVWKTKPGFSSNIVQSTIRRLRKKLDTGNNVNFIKNVHGLGYIISPEK